MHPRDVARAFGRVSGHEEVIEDLLTGNAPAGEYVPLLAGMLDMTVRDVFLPLISHECSYDGFAHPAERPLSTRIRLKDGSVIRITVEEEK